MPDPIHGIGGSFLVAIGRILGSPLYTTHEVSFDGASLMIVVEFRGTRVAEPPIRTRIVRDYLYFRKSWIPQLSARFRIIYQDLPAFRALLGDRIFGSERLMLKHKYYITII
jgi:hypothetical protein